jgi:hypothetical protein
MDSKKIGHSSIKRHEGMRENVGLVVFLILCLVFVTIWLNVDRLHVYQKYWTQTSQPISMRLTGLNSQMTEEALRQHFAPVMLTCINQPKAQNSMGDRVCYAAIDRADNLPALTLAGFFDQGRLRFVLMHTPWWAHQRWLNQIVHSHGVANRAGQTPNSHMSNAFGQSPVLRWQLPKGHIEFNRDRGFDPLAWSTLLWTASRSPAPS